MEGERGLVGPIEAVALKLLEGYETRRHMGIVSIESIRAVLRLRAVCTSAREGAERAMEKMLHPNKHGPIRMRTRSERAATAGRRAFALTAALPNRSSLALSLSSLKHDLAHTSPSPSASAAMSLLRKLAAQSRSDEVMARCGPAMRSLLLTYGPSGGVAAVEEISAVGFHPVFGFWQLLEEMHSAVPNPEGARSVTDALLEKGIIAVQDIIGNHLSALKKWYEGRSTPSRLTMDVLAGVSEAVVCTKFEVNVAADEALDQLRFRGLRLDEVLGATRNWWGVALATFMMKMVDSDGAVEAFGLNCCSVSNAKRIIGTL